MNHQDSHHSETQETHRAPDALGDFQKSRRQLLGMASIAAAGSLLAKGTALAALTPVAPKSAKPETAAAAPFVVQKFELENLTGLSGRQIEQHLNLYAGYVKNVNLLLEKLKEARSQHQLSTPETTEIRRRLAFEMNGMRLHELYFSALRAKAPGVLSDAALQAVTQSFGSLAALTQDLTSVAMMRGIGWALLVRDRASQQLFTTWIESHEHGHFANADILIALDVWEHAYMVDYSAQQRKEYVAAFFKNLDWGVVDARFKA